VAAGGGHWLLLSAKPLPESLIGCGQGYAASAWFQSNHAGKQIGQTKRNTFLSGSAYKPGILGYLLVIDWQPMSLKFNW